SRHHAACRQEAGISCQTTVAGRVLRRERRARGTPNGGAAMSENHASPRPTPQPFCAIYAPLLPLLHTGGLTAEEAASTEAHLGDCAWCQHQLATYDVVDAALRRHYGDETVVSPARTPRRRVRPALTLENIMQASNQPPLTLSPAPPPAPRRAPRRVQPPLAALASLAAVLVVALLAGSLSAYFGSHQSGSATGKITQFRIPTAGSFPQAITRGPDGNLWFTEYIGNRIGRIMPTGSVTEFPLPTANSAPLGITSGPDGNLWFTETDANQIGRITVAGTVTEYPVPTVHSNPGGIT